MKSPLAQTLEHFYSGDEKALKASCLVDLGGHEPRFKTDESTCLNHGYFTFVLTLLGETSLDQRLDMLARAFDMYLKVTHKTNTAKIDVVECGAAVVLRAAWAVDPDLALDFWARARLVEQDPWFTERYRQHFDRTLIGLLVNGLQKDSSAHGALLGRALGELDGAERSDLAVGVLRQEQDLIPPDIFYDQGKRGAAIEQRLALWEELVALPHVTGPVAGGVFLFLCETLDYPDVSPAHRGRHEGLLRRAWARVGITLDELLDVADLSYNDRERLGWPKQLGVMESVQHFFIHKSSLAPMAAYLLRNVLVGVGNDFFGARHNALFDYCLDQAQNGGRERDVKNTQELMVLIDRARLRQETDHMGTLAPPKKPVM